MNTFHQLKILSLLLSFSLLSYGSLLKRGPPLHHLEKTKGLLALPDGKALKVYMAISEEEKIQGLSNLEKKSFEEDKALLFSYKETKARKFWMYDMHFDLAIIFLDENLRIIKKIARAKKHPGKKIDKNLYETPLIFAKHILELRADSPFAKKMVEGMILKWRR